MFFDSFPYSRTHSFSPACWTSAKAGPSEAPGLAPAPSQSELNVSHLPWSSIRLGCSPALGLAFVWSELTQPGRQLVLIEPRADQYGRLRHLRDHLRHFHGPLPCPHIEQVDLVLVLVRGCSVGRCDRPAQPE